jgi:hypothetical protein
MDERSSSDRAVIVLFGKGFIGPASPLSVWPGFRPASPAAVWTAFYLFEMIGLLQSDTS